MSTNLASHRVFSLMKLQVDSLVYVRKLQRLPVQTKPCCKVGENFFVAARIKIPKNPRKWRKIPEKGDEEG